MGDRLAANWAGMRARGGRALFLIAVAVFCTQSASANGVPHLLLPGGAPLFDFEFGSAGSGDGQFGFLDGVAVDKDGNIYAADSGSHEIDKFDSAGVFITSWGTQGSGDGEFQYPRDVAIDSEGNIYVADTENHRIQKLSSTGVFITAWGTNGSGNGQFNYPYFLTLDASDNVYVSDRDNARIQKFNSEGTYLTQWGGNGSGDGQFSYPLGLAIDGQGDVYVVDAGNYRVEKFRADGTFVTKWGTFGLSPGQFWTGMSGIAADLAGNIHVANVDMMMPMNAGIQIFDNSGNYLSLYGTWGFSAGQFGRGTDVAVASSGDLIFSDQLNRKILVYNPGVQDAGASIAVTMDEDGVFSAPDLTAEDSAGDVNLIVWSVSNPASAGTAVVTGTGGAPSTFTYTPAPNFNGSDSFEITITDSDNFTDTITVNVTVNAVDDLPIITQGAGPLAVTMDEDSDPTAFVAPALGATDGDGDTLTWSLSTQALHGAAVVSGSGASPGTFTYVPDGNFSGSDSFTIEVTDGTYIDAITVDVTVEPINDIPLFVSAHEFAGKWGDPGTDPGQFNSPVHIAADSAGNIYVADHINNRIQKFDPDGAFLTQWGTPGTGNGQFSLPAGIDVDSSGNVYVAEFAGNRVQKFDSSGIYLTQWGSMGTGDNQLSSPVGLAVSPSGKVYVADRANNRVQVFDSSGTYLSTLAAAGSGDGQVSGPNAVCVDESGNVYVADTGNHRVQKFDSSGTYEQAWGSSGTGDARFTSIFGIAVRGGALFVADLSANEIQEFTTSGEFVARWGSTGTGDGQLNGPMGVEVSSSDRLYVSEYTGNRIQYFEREPIGSMLDVTMDEDGDPLVFALGLRAKDADFDTVTWSISSSASNGAADVSGTGLFKEISYTPTLNFNGSDSFDVQIDDGQGGTDTVTVNVTVNPQQDAPVITEGAGPLTVEMDEDGIFTTPTVSATDIDTGDTLTWSVSGQALHGTATVSGTGGSPSILTYVPAPDFNGIDSFTVEVSDGTDIDAIVVNVTVNPTNDAPALNAPFAHAGKWGTLGAAQGELDFPFNISLDSSGNVYVPEVGNDRIQVFGPDGEFIRTWGSAGSGDGQFNDPMGVDVDASGNVYVADSSNNRIQKFDASGNYLTQWGSGGSGSGEFSGIRDLAVAPNGHVYAVDQGNQRIQRFAPNGAFVTAWGSSGTGDGQFLNPQSIAFDAAGNAYVTDADSSRVQVFDPSGAFVRAFGSAGTDPGQFSFVIGIDVGADGTVYTADYNGSRIQAFRSTGEFLWQIGTNGIEDGQTANPVGVAVSDSGRVYVSEDATDRIQYFEAPTSGSVVNITMDEDGIPTAFALNLTANDRDADALTWSISSQGTNGTASVSGSGYEYSIGYTPNANFNGSDSFDVQVDDGNGGTAIVTVNVTINPQQDAVVIDQAPSVSVTMDEDGIPTAWVAPALSATDLDGDTLTWSILSQATNGTATAGGDGISPTTLEYVPTANFNGTDSFTLQVSDGLSTDSVEVGVTVSPVNDAPVITQTGPLSVTMDEDGFPQDFVAPTLSATDIDFDSLGWAVTTQASHGTASASGSGDSPSTVSYTPELNFNGSDSFVVSASDGHSTAEITIDVTVTSVNDSPVIILNSGAFVDEGGTQTIDAGMLDSLDADDAAADLHYTVDSATRNGQLELSGAPGVAVSEFTQADVNGALLVYVHNGGETVEDSFGFSLADGGEDGAVPATGTFVITVVPANDPPVLDAIGGREVAEGATLTFSVSATDPEGDALTFDAADLPEGASFDAETATFTWTPGFDQSGVYSDVLFRVTDDGDAPLTDTEAISITVGDVNRPPALDELTNQEVAEDATLTFTVTASDPDGDGLTFSASNLPEGAGFDPDTATFTWTPGFENAGVYPDVAFTVVDDGDPVQADSQSITITVGDVNRMPELAAIGNRQVDEGVELTFAVTASDADGDTLTYTVEGLPEGASFDTETLAFTWTPDFGDAGSYDVTFTVTDDGSPVQSDSETVNILVGDINRAPELNPVGNQEVTEGESLSIVISATDPDGDGLTFSAEDLPAGASIDGATGALNWTPAVGDAGTYEVSIVVTDDGTPPLSDDETITITVLFAGGGEGSLATALLDNFMTADTNGDGMVSMEESQLLFPELTALQFESLDLDGDGFLTRGEIRSSQPGGCFGPGATEEFFFAGLGIYLYNMIESLLRIPQQILGIFYGNFKEEEPEE